MYYSIPHTYPANIDIIVWHVSDPSHQQRITIDLNKEAKLIKAMKHILLGAYIL